jgi:hypothetical protein
MVEALSERAGALAYRVDPGPAGTAVETPLAVTGV